MIYCLIIWRLYVLNKFAIKEVFTLTIALASVSYRAKWYVNNFQHALKLYKILWRLKIKNRTCTLNLPNVKDANIKGFTVYTHRNTCHGIVVYSIMHFESIQRHS